MAVTAVLVHSGPNRLRYLATQDGAAGTAFTIPNDGGATPDLLTDIEAVGEGPSVLREIIRARTDGYGPLPAAALTQAQAQAILNSNDPTNAVLTNFRVKSAQIVVTPRDAAEAWGVTVNVDGAGDPDVDITAGATASSAFIDIILGVSPFNA